MAESPSPEGPFTKAKQLFYPKSINEGKALEHIDPAVFVDNDGGNYYYWGQFNGQSAQLKDNMYELIEGTYQPEMVTEEVHFFHEGSSMRKIGDRYYFIYCDTSTGRANTLSYATSDMPQGPFTYRGVIIDNYDADPESWNIHGSIAQIKDQWYVFYHRSSNNSRFSRRACMEPIKIDSDGKIHQVEMTTQGSDRPMSAYDKLLAARACKVAGGNYIGLPKEGIYPLVNNINGCCAGYKYLDFGEGLDYEGLKVTLCIKVIADAGSIAIVLDDEKSEPVGEVSVKGLPKNEWIDVSIDLGPVAGIRALYLSFSSEKDEDSICQVNWFRFSK